MSTEIKEEVVESEVEEVSTEEAEPERKKNPSKPMRWYVVNTYSGQENRAKLNLLERAESNGLWDEIGDVLIPTENVMEFVKGQRRTSTRKFYPGYMFVQMALTDKTLSLLKNTPKITGFLGGKRPSPVPEREIRGIRESMNPTKEAPRTKAQYAVGQKIRIVDGAFANTTTTVEEVSPDKEKLVVLVSMLGGMRKVELKYSQVEKVS